MPNTQKAKGDRAEREAAELLTALLERPVRRQLGAGRQDDTGDLDGVPGTAVQVAHWEDVNRALRQKPIGAEIQAIHRGVPHSAAFIRLRGRVWRAVLTPEAFARLVLAAERGRQ
jgi:hypothetical protein